MEENRDSRKKHIKKMPIKGKDKVSNNIQGGKTLDVNNTSNTKKGKKKNKKIGWKIFRICLFVFIALLIIGVGVVLGVISGIIDETDSLAEEELDGVKLTSFVYDKDGNQIGEFFDEENRVSIEYKDIPTHVVDAIVAIEDERFFEHKGVDFKRTIAAIGTYILNKGDSTFGGSTITQQLVKNIKEDNEKTWKRKIREWYRAFVLESKVDKERIFAAYASTVYLGDGAYGVEVAARNYFGKSIKDVNIAEAAVLAAAIQSPEATNPYRSDEAKEKLLERQKVVLAKMKELGKITEEQYNEALNYEIVFTKASNETSSGEKIQSYFVDAVFEQVKEDLMEQLGWTEVSAVQKLYTDGLKIYSTQDTSVQNAINDAYNNDAWFYTDSAGTFMQGATVVIEQSTGNVVGLIGGADTKTGNRQFNRATQAYRQPGSCMKPLGAYGPAMELGLIGPGSGIDDSNFPAGTAYNPHNYYAGFNGFVTVRNAIAQSMNLPAVRTNMKVDISYAFNFAKNAGLKDLRPASNPTADGHHDENTASMALGGVTDGFTVMEMANAYATIANGGLYIEPKLYTKVVDKNGKELLTTTTEAKRVMKDSTAYMLTSCLQTVVTGGTATGYIRAGNMPIAGKTGNTNDDKDQWFCGFTPYYTIACWNGYDDPKPIGYRTGTRTSYPYTSMRTFNSIVNAISAGKEVKQFERPASVINASVCRDSGLVATDACRTDPRGDRTINDMFASGTVPTATCTVHKKVKICNDTGKLAAEYCPNTSEKSFISRDYEPATHPADWQYMVPTETCTVHTTPPVAEKPKEEEKDDKDKDKDKDDNKVDVYGSGSSTNKPSSSTTTTTTNKKT